MPSDVILFDDDSHDNHDMVIIQNCSGFDVYSLILCSDCTTLCRSFSF